MATAVDTVSVEREALLDAIAWLSAAQEVFVSLNGRTDSNVGELFGRAEDGLRLAAFGPAPEGDDDYNHDPVLVETRARGYEHAATALDALSQTRELVKTVDVNDLFFEQRTLGKFAAEIREHRSLGRGKSDA
jgi:hypothetical protein